MKKHFSGEKQDFQLVSGCNLRIKAIINFIFPLIFFLLNEIVFPQVPINGLCKFNSFNVDSGYTKLLMVNYNNDAYSDLILLNPSKKKVSLVEGSLQGEFTGTKNFTLPLEINSVYPLNYRTSTKYVFTNRKERKAGLYELKPSGEPSLNRFVQFDSYPESITTADINSNGINEVLISGGAFNGLSLLFQADKKFTEKKIVSGESFSDAVFIELNNDGFTDIAAYNLVKRSFSFFYNNSLGEFRNARSLQFSEKPNQIKSFDVNLDSYEDLIFSTKNSINIWYGDFRSLYDNRKKIITNYKPDKFIYGDFNKDGFIDIAYLNIENSLVSLIYAKDEQDFFSEIVYLNQKDIKDIIPYYSRFIDGIAALSCSGKIYTITHISSFTEDVSISIGAKPGALSYFDNENNSITDFCFIDKYDTKIKFIVRDITGIPALYFSQSLFENHEKIIPENLKAGEKNFVCFSYNKKMIEVVKTIFGNKVISKTVLYSPGAILDLKISRESAEAYKIFVLFKVDKSLNLGVYDYRDLKFTFTSNELKNNIKIIDASFGINGHLVVDYWSESKNQISLFNIEPGTGKEISKELFSLPISDSVKIVSFTGDLLSMEKNVTISFINNNTILLSGSEIQPVQKISNDVKGFRITSKNDLFFGETRFNGLKKLSVFQPELNIISKLELIQQGRSIIFTNLAEDINNCESFFIKNMTSKNYHLVFSDSESGCITIKRLKG